MDENKSAIPARMTRSRRASVESPVASPARVTRNRKLKNIAENETDTINVDDFDDVASNASSNSIKSCKVVLRREKFDDVDTNTPNLEEDRSIAHSTRARRNSQLTEENVSAKYSGTAARRSSRGSVVSDGTESTQVSRPRSTRLAQSQNTPKKDSAIQPSTPARRSSRLLSENEKAAESPAKITPARRNLRSSSVASEDLSPTQVRRSSSRLNESQATPKSLKAKVSRIKTEPTTPRRTSMRMNNKSVIAADIIDEETDEEDIDENRKSKQPVQARKNIESDTAKDGKQQEVQADNDAIIIIDDEPEFVDVKPNEKPNIASKEIVTSSSDMIKSPRHTEMAQPVVASTSEPMASVILISTTTAKSPKSKTPLRKAQTPTVEPTEPMETSMTEVVEQIGTPKDKTQNITEQSKTPQIDSPKAKAMSGDLVAMDATGIINENVHSSDPASCNNISVADTTQMESGETEKLNEHKNQQQASNANVMSIEALGSAGDMEVDTVEPTATGETKEIIYSNKALENVKRNETSTPINNPRASRAFEALDVSALIQEDESVTPTTTASASNKSRARKSLNDTVQSTGFDRMEVSILAEESTKKGETSPKPPVPSASETVNTSRSSAKSQSKEHSFEELVNNDEFSKPVTPTQLRAARRTSFGGISNSLREQIDEIVENMKTPNANKENRRNTITTETPVTDNETDRHFDEIAKTITPSDFKASDKRFAEIAADLTPMVPKDAKQQVTSADEVTTENIGTSSDKDKHSSIIEDTDMSIVNETQFESTSPAIEPPLQNINASSSKSERKSVQIMTPVVDKNQQKMGSKRIDTPYPDEKSISETIATARSKSDERKRKHEEARSEAREALRKLGESWSQSIKRNSLSSQSPKPIDAFVVTETISKTEATASSAPLVDESPKKAVPARNNWQHLVDTESEPEEDDLIPESDEGTDGEEEQESENEFVNDEVEVAQDDYESGDSMDEDERREIEDNHIEEGVDIGSDDTEEDDEDDEYDSEDSFIVNEDHLPSSSESEEEIEKISKPKRRSSQIIEYSSSEESDSTEITGDSNDVVAVTVEQVESVVVIRPSNLSEVDAELIEGKTFPTTFFMPLEEDEVKSTKNTAEKNKSLESSVKADEVTANLGEEQQQNEARAQVVEKGQENTSSNVNKSADQDESKVGSEAPASEVDESIQESNRATEKQKDSGNANVTLQPNTTLSAVEYDGKENQTVPKKIKLRTSLPGIDRLPKSSIAKKNSRVSLGDLNPNAQNVSITQLKTQSIKAKAIEKKQNAIKNAANSEENELNTSRAALNISSQEENNNEKASKKAEVIEQTQNAEILPVHGNVQANQEGSQGRETVTSTSEDVASTSNASENRSKSKRRFIEIDIDEEAVQRAKPKKLLRIINSASGQFIEEPMTPEKKNKFGFTEHPRTPVNRDFKIQKRVQYPGKSNKRKSVYLNEDDDVDLLLPKPRWQINTQFEEEQPKKRARKLEVGSTEVILKPAVPKKKKKEIIYVPVDLSRYRYNILNRAGIPRQNARALLLARQKQMAYK